MSALELQRVAALVVVIQAVLFCAACGCTSKSAKPVAKRNVAQEPAIAAVSKERQSEPAIQPVAEDPSMNNALNERSVGTASLNDGSGDSLEAASPPQADQRPETWTSKRLVLLAPGGVVLIDLAINIGEKSVVEATQSVIDDLVQELLPESTFPLPWPKLLENPVIKSGWLGNLVPMENQVDQILSLYDQNRDGTASMEELIAFLTRGASRNESIRVVQTEAEGELLTNKSPWGPGDLNEDGVLDQQELAGLQQSLLRADFNGDQSVSQAELQTVTNLGVAAARMNENRSLIEQDLFIDWDATKEAQLAPRVIGHYAFSDQISRDDWFAWSDERWKMIDANSDSQLSSKELRKLGEVAADAQFDVRFPNSVSGSLDRKLSVTRNEKLDPVSPARWVAANNESGQLSLSNCWLRVETNDPFSSQVRQVFEQQLRGAFGNPQLQMIFTSRLELHSTAFEVLDADADQKLSAEEMQTAWKLFASIRQLRTIARAQSSLSPWFRMADQDGNRLLTTAEISQFHKTATACDRDRNELIETNEIPLAMSLILSRDDRGLIPPNVNLNRIPNRALQSNHSDWFSAMDANEDGFLSKSEFLGYPEDFYSLDTDKSDLISPAEVSAAQ